MTTGEISGNGSINNVRTLSYTTASQAGHDTVDSE